jgi:Brp/Blh family beta-carotene 15,15'-monooxygenase
MAHLTVTLLAFIITVVWQWDPLRAEWLALLLIILGGIPHGSFDLRVAEHRWGAIFHSRWVLILAYVAIGLLMSSLCLLFPTIGFTLFMLISVIHFIEGENLDTNPLAAIAIGIGSILLPIALHFSEAQAYLSFFITPAAQEFLKPYIITLGWIWCLGTLILLSWNVFTKRSKETVERLICLLGWILLTPLAGFAIWFVGRHARMHLATCRKKQLGNMSLISFDFLALSFLAISLIIPLGIWFNLMRIEELFAASIILIAGLTLPHMVVTKH